MTQPLQPQVAAIGSASSDPALDYMIRHNMPISIEEYLDYIFPEEVPEDISLAEVIPRELWFDENNVEPPTGANLASQTRPPGPVLSAASGPL